MKDTDSYMIFKSAGGSALIPVNQPAHEYVEQNYNREVALKDITTRDLKFTRAYFGMLRFIYDLLPSNFRSKVSSDNFYLFLKHLQGQYEVLYSFKDGTKMIEYKSISFGKMTQSKFKEYVANQLPVIYTDLIGAMFNQEESALIIEVIEDEWENYLSLFS